jgi:hypothetical protein
MENYKQWMEQKLTSEDMDKLPHVVKPLTDEQISNIYYEIIQDKNLDSYFFKFARAIEKAHNIK